MGILENWRQTSKFRLFGVFQGLRDKQEHKEGLKVPYVNRPRKCKALTTKHKKHQPGALAEQ